MSMSTFARSEKAIRSSDNNGFHYEIPYDSTSSPIIVALYNQSNSLIKSSDQTYIPNHQSEILEALQHHINARMKLNKTILSYSSFPDDWDGYDGKPAPQEIVDDALKFIQRLSEHIAIPSPGLAGDGNIDLIWKRKNLFINVTFIGNHKYSYYAHINNDEYFKDDVSPSDDLPLELINILKSIK